MTEEFATTSSLAVYMDFMNTGHMLLVNDLNVQENLQIQEFTIYEQLVGHMLKYVSTLSMLSPFKC